MLKRKFSLVLSLVLLTVFLMSGTLYANTELIASHVLGPDHHYQYAFEVMRDIIEVRTDGEITMTIHHSASLYEEEEALEALQAGVIDITTVSAAPMTGFVSEYMAADLPFQFDSIYDAYEFFDGEIGDLLFEKSAEVGIIGLSWWDNGFRNLTNSVRQITSPDDMQGLTIRTMYSPPHMATMEALGASATPIAFGELYSALESGVVDGQENPVANIHEMHFYEVQDYLTISRHFYDPSPTFISEHTWNDLSEEHQEIVREASIIARDYMRSLANRRENALLDDMRDEIDVYVLSDDEMAAFREATAEVAFEFEDEIGADFLDQWLDALEQL